MYSDHLFMQAITPGDLVFQLPETGTVRIGTGLYDHSGGLVATKIGVLNQTKDGKFWIAGRQKRYTPSIGDPVLGTIKSKHSEYFEVDIGAPFTALLPILAFEGATKRNRPTLREGDLVYCRVDTTDRDIQPTLSCMDTAGRSAGFGPLVGGHQCKCSSAYARMLLTTVTPLPLVLSELSRSLQFDIAIGANGRVWVDSSSIDVSIAVARVLEGSEGMQPQEIKAFVKKVLGGSSN